MPEIEVKFAPDPDEDPLREDASAPYETANELVAERLADRLGFKGRLIRRKRFPSSVSPDQIPEVPPSRPEAGSDQQ